MSDKDMGISFEKACENAEAAAALLKRWGTPLPWSDPRSNPLEDMRRAWRQAEEDYRASHGG